MNSAGANNFCLSNLILCHGRRRLPLVRLGDGRGAQRSGLLDRARSERGEKAAEHRLLDCELLDAKPLLVAEAGVHHEVHADPWRAGRVGRDMR